MSKQSEESLAWDGISTRRHDFGVFAFAKNVGVLWVGLAPILFGMRLLVLAEIRDQNTHQDELIAKLYVSRSAFEERMQLLDERAKMNADLLHEMKDDLKALRARSEVDVISRGRR